MFERNLLKILSVTLALFLGACGPYHAPGDGVSALGEDFEIIKVNSDDSIVVKLKSGNEKTVKAEEVDFNFVTIGVSKKYCLECHSSARKDGGYEMQTYAGALEKVTPSQPQSSRAYLSMVEKTMPKSGPKPGQPVIDAVRVWIKHGAKEKASQPDGEEPPKKELPKLKEKSFKGITEAVLAKHCNSCHKEGGTASDFTKYENLIKLNGVIDKSLDPKKSALYESVEKDRMPSPKGFADKKLKEAALKALAEWIKDGARKEKGGEKFGDKPRELPKLKELSYKGMNDFVIKGYCVSCHQPGGKAKKHDFSSYSALMSGGYINVDDPRNSSFIKRMLLPHDHKRVMPPRGIKDKELLDRLIEEIVRWIEAGAPEKKGDVRKKVFTDDLLSEYKSWKTVHPDASKQFESEHPKNPNVRVFFSKSSEAVFEKFKKDGKNAKFPEDAVLVKETYGENGAVKALTLMKKKKPGYNSKARDWAFARAEVKNGQASYVTDVYNGRIKMCNSCHGKANLKKYDSAKSLQKYVEFRSENPIPDNPVFKRRLLKRYPKWKTVKKDGSAFESKAHKYMEGEREGQLMQVKVFFNGLAGRMYNKYLKDDGQTDKVSFLKGSVIAMEALTDPKDPNSKEVIFFMQKMDRGHDTWAYGAAVKHESGQFVFTEGSGTPKMKMCIDCHSKHDKLGSVPTLKNYLEWNKGTVKPPPPPPSDEVDFATVTEKVFKVVLDTIDDESSCLHCHAEDLATREKVLMYVVPGKPLESPIYRMVKGGDLLKRPGKPNLKGMPDEDAFFGIDEAKKEAAAEILKKWIEAGAK